MGERTSLVLHEGMTGLLEDVFINVKNRSVSITADLEIPRGGAGGAILAQGGRFGGWALHLQGGKLVYTYNFLGLEPHVGRVPESGAARPGHRADGVRLRRRGDRQGRGRDALP